MTRIESLLGIVADEFLIHPKVLLGRSRVQPVATARQAVFLILKGAGWSLTSIGDALDRNHTTVLHGIESISTRLATDPQLAAQVQAIRTRLADLSAVG